MKQIVIKIKHLNIVQLKQKKQTELKIKELVKISMISIIQDTLNATPCYMNNILKIIKKSNIK